MKTINITLLLVLIITFFSCTSNEEDNTDSVCLENNIVLTEREVIAPVTNATYLVGMTFKNIQADRKKIQVIADINDTRATAIIEIENFTNTIGSQQLNSNPIGRIKYLGETFTTDYQPNGQSSFPIEPKGEISINDFQKNCNTLSGTIFIQAYALSNTLGEIRFSVKFDFKNIPLDNQEYLL